MIKKIGLLTLVVCLLLVMLTPAVVQASGGLTVTGASVKVNFPASIDFALSVKSDVNVTDIRLHYTVDRMKFAEVISEVYIEFEPAPSVDAQWTWDMRRTGGMPPGSSLEYWWTVKDASGGNITTQRTRLQVEDTRNSWRSLTQKMVTLYWYTGDDAFAQKLMAAIQQALTQLAGNTGAELTEAVKIYIYGNSSDLQGSMIFPQEWTGGVAYTEYGIIAIGIAPNNLDWGVGAIAHELTHLVVHQVTFNPYSGLPTWLDEGLAMYAQGALDPGFQVLLLQAIANNSLISVRSLSSPFSAYSGQASLAYAESYSVVKFLTETYGREKMFELLKTFKQGSSYDSALLKVYGFDMDKLNTLWQDYLTKKSVWIPGIQQEIQQMTAGFMAAPAYS